MVQEDTTTTYPSKHSWFSVIKKEPKLFFPSTNPSDEISFLDVIGRTVPYLVQLYLDIQRRFSVFLKKKKRSFVHYPVDLFVSKG